MSAPLRVLVVYGVPARMKLTDAANKDIGKTFVLTKSNRESFEPALRNALTVFMGSDAVVPGARFVFIRGAGDFEAAVRSAEYTHVIYYGHALDGETALLPAKGSKFDADGLARALKGTTVTHFDILGCRSTSIAAQLSTMLPGVRIGYLRAAREDNVEADPRNLQVISLSIDRQTVLHYGGATP
jgi:hypothetical protein